MLHTARFCKALLLIVCLAPLGCRGRDGEVTGKVTYRGTPLTAGSVTFRSGELVRGASIQKDGTYTLQDCPAGDYKVAVVVPDLRFAPRPSGAPPIPKTEMPGKAAAEESAAVAPVKIDARYKDVNTSGLSYKVGSGGQTIDIELK